MSETEAEEEEFAYRVTIPLRDSEGGDIVLSGSPFEDAYLTFPMSQLDRLVDLQWVCMKIERVAPAPAGDSGGERG